MKKTAIIILVIMLTLVFVFAFAGCRKQDGISDKYTDLSVGGTFEKNSGVSGESAIFDFGKTVTLNTLVLKEKTDSVTCFRMYADGSDTAFYGNDFIQGHRYCAFDTVSLQKLRIEVVSSDGKWEIDSLNAYNISDTEDASSFRIMSYITVDSTFYFDAQEYKDNFAKVTQFNVFGALYLDKDGNLIYQDYEKDGKTVDGEQALADTIDLIREYNPSADIVATVLGNKDFTGDNLDPEQRHTSAMDDNRDKLISNVLGVIEKYGLDGISFDYEYPYALKSYSVYKSFLKELDSKLPQGKLLTAAVSAWQLGIGKFSARDLEVLDQIEVMAYDSFDKRGNHSTFYTSCYSVLSDFRSKNFDMSKINLGVPFYSRPVDGASFWGNYKDIAAELSPWENTYVQPYTDLDGKEYAPLANYYNGIQMIKDKTAYSLDSGVGGIMIWHFACDSSDPDLSLINAICEVVETRG